MLELSRRCIPWTPFHAKLTEARVCLVTSAAVRMTRDPPFDPEGDTSFRMIEASARASDLTYDDTHYDHACADQDINCIFPIDRLATLASEQIIRGITDRHFSFGFSTKLRELREKTFPEIVALLVHQRPDLVLLTGG